MSSAIALSSARGRMRGATRSPGDAPASSSTTATNHARQAVRQAHDRRAPRGARLHLLEQPADPALFARAASTAHPESGAAIHRAGVDGRAGGDARPAATRR